jgi:hypothetical protein
MNEPTDNEPIDTEDFANRAKGAFDDSVERLDAAALSRLNQSRHAALEGLLNGEGKADWRRWAPAGGVAAVALVTVMVMRGPSIESMPSEVVSDFDILLEGESLDMYEELEFYSWMDDADLDGSGNVG